jgi:2-C-methyl-D-erythritol 2,4-cyclodiphosphate synthase
MDIPTGSVSIKATTTEKLGFVGQEEGIAVYAVALIT